MRFSTKQYLGALLIVSAALKRCQNLKVTKELEVNWTEEANRTICEEYQIIKMLLYQLFRAEALTKKRRSSWVKRSLTLGKAMQLDLICRGILCFRKRLLLPRQPASCRQGLGHSKRALDS